MRWLTKQPTLISANPFAEPAVIHRPQVGSFTILHLILLTFIVFISVIKPWGQRKQKVKVNRKIVVSAGLIIGVLLTASSIMQYLQLLVVKISEDHMDLLFV